MWYTFSDPNSRFTNTSLGFICDTFPQIIESFSLGKTHDPYSVAFEQQYSRSEQESIIRGGPAGGRMWYPTLLLNLEVKKALPEAGVKWLFVRLECKRILNGRYDLEVLILDAEGELVAVSNHVCFALGSERNTAARRKSNDTESSKL